MKKINYILILFLIVPFFGSGQLKGNYSQSYGYSAETFIFLDSNKFKYYQGSCTQETIGKGDYLLKNNELILFYKGKPKEKKKVIAIPDTNKDELKLTIFDVDDFTYHVPTQTTIYKIQIDSNKKFIQLKFKTQKWVKFIKK